MVAYCYDNADRLTSTTVTNPPAGASPVAGTNLTATTLQYDAHRNTTVLGNQTMTYDVADRHMSTTVNDGGTISTVTYQRDATGRIVARTSTVGGTSTTIEYLYAAGTLFGVANGSGALLERDLSLPGGVSVTIPTGTPATPGAASTFLARNGCANGVCDNSVGGGALHQRRWWRSPEGLCYQCGRNYRWSSLGTPQTRLGWIQAGSER